MDSVPSTSKCSEIPNNPSESDEIHQKQVFKCYHCSLEECYEYKGNNPPFAKHVLMSEDCYITEDPFSPPRTGEFMVLGSDCSVCAKPVCKGTGCSFFYKRTYCASCVKLHLDSFPTPVRIKVNKNIKI